MRVALAVALVLAAGAASAQDARPRAIGPVECGGLSALTDWGVLAEADRGPVSEIPDTAAAADPDACRALLDRLEFGAGLDLPGCRALIAVIARWGFPEIARDSAAAILTGALRGTDEAECSAVVIAIATEF